MTLDIKSTKDIGLSSSESYVQCQGLTPKPTTRNYTYLKIADGCDRKCRYCVIPSIKGRYRSEDPDSILKKAEKEIRNGMKELILIAQDITSYGKDIGYDLGSLIRDIASIDGDFWIRLLYLYPTSIDDNLLEIIKTEDKVCNYLDIPLQHSEDRILKAMGRGGSRKYYFDLIQRIRQYIPDVILRTTFIVGFPGEIENDFQGLKSFIKEVRFDRLGVFVYSDEDGTSAYGMNKKISNAVKQKRMDDLMRLQAEISREKNRKFVGRKFKAIMDEINSDVILARMYSHAPEIDGNVIIEKRRGQQVYTFHKKKVYREKSVAEDKHHVECVDLTPFVTVEILDADEYDLVGRIVK